MPFTPYVDALLADLETEIEYVDGRDISTIFLGGGTPSLFPAEAVARLLEGVRRALSFQPDVEITLEANPGAADAARFAAYRMAGINRLSIGAQSFRDEQLKQIGRVHDAGAVYAALAAARAAGFENINIDLMHGLPGDRADDSLFDLRAAIEFEPNHISWYELTLEAGTAFVRKPPKLPAHDAVAREFDAGVRLLAVSGYECYEISAYARAGARARHNLNYWEFGDYIGIGAGAHGKLTTAAGVYRTEKRRHPQSYISSAGSAQCTTRSGPLSNEQLVAEFAMNALRLREGWPEDLFTARTGLPAAAAAEGLNEALERGWILRDAGVVRPTALGYRFLNDLQLLFVA